MKNEVRIKPSLCLLIDPLFTNWENGVIIVLVDALYLEFQHPVGLCQNEELQAQLNSQNGQENSSILYPGQLYHNWFTIDLYAQDPSSLPPID